MCEGAVHHDWLIWQIQRCHTCPFECRIRGHIVGLVTPKFKRYEKFGRL